MFERFFDNIYRLRVPFENIYTSVFLVDTDGGKLLIDAGDGESDVKNIILPALEKMNVIPDILAVTHSHGDHAGGLGTLAHTFENAKICAFNSRITENFSQRSKLLCDGDILLDCIKIIHLPGHSSDSIGFLDMRSNILIGGDAVQLYGIARYGCGLGSPNSYRNTIGKIKSMHLSMYVASHDFFPLGAFAKGEEVEKYLDEALLDLDCITEFAIKHQNLAYADIAAEFTKINREKHADFPTIPSGTVKVILEDK